VLRLVGVLAVFASGCRFNFGDRPDAARDVAGDDTGDTGDVLLGHDEDGDGVADADDFCPHIADTDNKDTDGDLVGDSCDAEPAAANQQWLLFSAMTDPSLPDFAVSTEWTPGDDSWGYIDGANPAQLIRTGMVGSVDVWIGFDVVALGGNGRQAAIVLNGLNTPYWYAEIYDDGSSGARLSVMEYTGASYVARASKQPLAPMLPLGPNELHFEARAGVSFTARSGADAVLFATAGYTGERFIHVSFGNHSGRLRYIAIVESQ
jgi:hypothetical protein